MLAVDQCYFPEAPLGKCYSCYHLPGFVCERENLWRSLDLKGAISMTADLVPRLCKVEAEFGTIRHPPYFV